MFVMRCSFPMSKMRKDNDHYSRYSIPFISDEVAGRQAGNREKFLRSSSGPSCKSPVQVVLRSTNGPP